MSDEPTTALSLRPTAAERREMVEEIRKAPAGKMPAAVAEKLEKMKIIHRVAAKIGALSWGKQMHPDAQLAMAMWGDRYGVDVTTEIDVLGGRLYKNGTYYLNRAAPLLVSGEFRTMTKKWAHHDARATPEEQAARLQLRVDHAIPEAAAAACIARVVLASGEAFEAANWCGGGTRKGDPVGDERPQLTAETRAYRRVLRLLISHVPTYSAIAEPAGMAADGAIVENVIREGRELARAADPRQLSPGLTTFDPLEAVGQRVEPVEELAPVVASTWGAEPDLSHLPFPGEADLPTPAVPGLTVNAPPSFL